jgi:hypothetical protein
LFTIIYKKLKSVLREEITIIIKSVFKDEIENYTKDSLHTVTNEIEVLKLDNTKLKAAIDVLEQYGRRELIRFRGIAKCSPSFRPLLALIILRLVVLSRRRTIICLGFEGPFPLITD